MSRFVPAAAATPCLKEAPLRPPDSLVGRPLDLVPTPFALLDGDALQRNIDRMAALLSELGVAHRPHTKTHKCAEIARAQLRAGARGLTCATMPEARLMSSVAGGDASVLIARSLAADAAKIAEIARLACHTDLSMVIEEVDQVAPLAAACRAEGSTLGLLVELDVGFGRAGLRDKHSALALAAAIGRHPELRFEGLLGYEAHAMRIVDDDERRATVHEALDRLAAAKAALEAAGHEVRTVSVGGTITYRSAAEHPVSTEVRSGGYVFMHATARAPATDLAAFEQALSVRSSVIGSYADGRIVLDAGLKSVSTDGGLHLRVRGLEGSVVVMVTEEHLVLDTSAAARRPTVGERLDIVSSHSCTTANLHGHYVLTRGGDDVADVWPVAARY